MSDQLETPNERDSLKARADLMGIKYQPNIPTDKLKELIAGGLGDVDVREYSDSEVRTLKLNQLKAEATKLIRVNITCFNPAKKDWQGEIFTVSNSSIPVMRKFVLFNTPDGFHVPQMILDVMKERMFQHFSINKQRGVDIPKKTYQKEFGIEYLPALTEKELKELARVQAMRNAKD